VIAPIAFKFPPTVLQQHLAILGRTGSGKSYTAKGAVESLLTDKRRVCILDPTGIWYGLRSSADGKRAGFPVVVFGGQHGDVAINDHSGPALAKLIAEQNLPAIIDLSEMLIGQRHRFVTDFAEALYRENRTPLHLVIDEADEFCPQNPLPETKRMLHHIDRIVRRGRVRGFRVMLITQRPAVLNKNVLTQANALIAMRLTGPQDRIAMKAWIDGQGDPVTGKVVLDSLAQLKVGEGWVWAPEVDMLERVQFPLITTFDSGRTPGDDEKIAPPTKLAAVDISGITASFTAIEHEATTVKELQAELAKLHRIANSASKSPVAKAAPGVSEAEVKRRIDEAVAAVPKVATPLGGVSKKTLVAAVEKIAAGLQAIQAELAGVDVDFVPRARTIVREKPVIPLGVTGTVRPHVDVSAPQQRILNAIAQLNAFGVDSPAKPMIGAHAGASPRSSGFTNNLSSLRTAGLVDYPGPGLVALTDAGRSKAQAPDKKPTLLDLHSSWLAILARPQQAIVNELIGCWPKALSKPDLASRIGVSAASSGYTNNLSSLRTLGLLDYPGPGQVVATDLLFPKGTK
jgi:hypothetical protein